MEKKTFELLEICLYDDEKCLTNIYREAIHLFVERVNKAKEEGKMIKVEIVHTYDKRNLAHAILARDGLVTTTRYIDTKAIKYIESKLVVGETLDGLIESFESIGR